MKGKTYKYTVHYNSQNNASMYNEHTKIITGVIDKTFVLLVQQNNIAGV